MLLTDTVLDRHPHLVEEDLVEVRVAGDLTQRADVDAGRVHVDDERRDAVVLRRGGVAAEQAETEVAVVRTAGPDLLAA